MERSKSMKKVKIPNQVRDDAKQGIKRSRIKFGMTRGLCRITPMRWYLIIAVIAYAVLQFFTLGTRSFDGDEGVVLRVASADSWSQFWTFLANDVHPPLYHLLAKLSVSIFGVHEWSLRLPSAVAGGLLILLGYWLGKKIWQGDKWKALVLGVFLGLAPYLFYFHQEARFYSLLLLGVVITYGALLDIAKKQNIRSWIIFTLGALILVWTQYLGWFILGAEFIAVLALRQWKMIGGALVVLGLLVASYLPYMKIAQSQFSGRLSEQGGWLLGQNVIGLTGALYRFGADRLVLGTSPDELLVGDWYKILLFVTSLIIPLYIMIKGIDSNKKYRLWRRLAWVTVGFSVLMALFVSEVGGRSSRYLVYLWPFYGALLITGLWRLWKKLSGKIIVLLLVILWLGTLGKHILTENKSVGAKNIALYLNNKVGANDVVLVKGALAGGEQAALKFYYGGPGAIVDYQGDYKPGDLSKTSAPAEEKILALMEKYPIVWYYDFTYGTLNIGPQGIFVSQKDLGADKEEKEVIIYKVTQ